MGKKYIRVNGVKIPKDSSTSDCSSFLKEQSEGKEKIASSIRAKGLESDNTDTFTELADKILEIKDIEVINPPATEPNKFATDWLNSLNESQGTLDIYDSVFEQYVTRGTYAGTLMTTLVKDTNTSIVLSGADAYYIFEDNKFYDANITHLWSEDTNIKNVFYLYLPESTADGVRENVHYSMIDICKGGEIPVILRHATKGGVYCYIDLTSDLKYNLLGSSSANERQQYFYIKCDKLSTPNDVMGTLCNGEIQIAININILNNLFHIYHPRTKQIINNSLVQLNGIDDIGTFITCSDNVELIRFLKLETIKGVLFSYGNCNNIELLMLKNINDCILISSNTRIKTLNLHIEHSINSEICSLLPNLELLNCNECVDISKAIGNVFSDVGNDKLIVNFDKLEDININGSIAHGVMHKCKGAWNFPKLRKLTGYLIDTYDVNNYINKLHFGNKGETLFNIMSHISDTNLKELIIDEGFKNSINCSKCNGLTKESLLGLLNNCADLASEGLSPQTLNLGQVNVDKLTDEEIEIATDKGWNVTPYTP